MKGQDHSTQRATGGASRAERSEANAISLDRGAQSRPASDAWRLVHPEFRRKVLEPLLDGPLAHSPLRGVKVLAEQDGVALDLAGASAFTAIVRACSGDTRTMPRSHRWEFFVIGACALGEREWREIELVLECGDSFEGAPIVEPDRLADQLPPVRKTPPSEEVQDLLARYRPPRAVAWHVGATRAKETVTMAGRLLSYLCENIARPDRATTSVCDVGSGPGLLVDLVRSAGFARAFGLDRRIAAISVARIARVPVRFGDARWLDWHLGRQAVDVITLMQVFNAPGLGSRTHCLSLLRPAVLALKPGGTLLIEAPGDTLQSDLGSLGLRRQPWPNPRFSSVGQPLHVFVKARDG